MKKPFVICLDPFRAIKIIKKAERGRWIRVWDNQNPKYSHKLSATRVNKNLEKRGSCRNSNSQNEENPQLQIFTSRTSAQKNSHQKRQVTNLQISRCTEQAIKASEGYR